jgi:hypothetical protein
VKGWWDMHCWNALSDAQQSRLITVGNLAFPWIPEREGGCPRGADVAIETHLDVAPGPRFYCFPCGIEYLRTRGS